MIQSSGGLMLSFLCRTPHRHPRLCTLFLWVLRGRCACHSSQFESVSLSDLAALATLPSLCRNGNILHQFLEFAGWLLNWFHDHCLLFLSVWLESITGMIRTLPRHIWKRLRPRPLHIWSPKFNSCIAFYPFDVSAAFPRFHSSVRLGLWLWVVHPPFHTLLICYKCQCQ